MTEVELMTQLAILTPLIVGFVQMAKMVGLPAKYSPFLAVLVGMAVAPFITELPLVWELIGGAIIGLSASGLWETGKAVKKST